MEHLLIFDDGRGRLGPLTDLRAAFDVRTGMLTTAERIRQAWSGADAAYAAPETIAPVVAERTDAPVNRVPDGTVRLVNGRWCRPDARLAVKKGEAAVSDDGAVVTARLDASVAAAFLETGALPDGVPAVTCDAVLYRDPWDVLRELPETLLHDIAATRVIDAMIAGDGDVMGTYPVTVHESARIGPRVVFDVEQGPVVVHERAVVRPGAILCGPCSIGPGSTVAEHAVIKANTVIGPVCKVGGEVGATIFQGYSNKAHDGHLGDAWIGEWVNLGAGTTNSNLLNTYGEVAMRTEPDGPRQRTGMTFLGTIAGDHVKTAIGTRLMTGTLLGTGAMVASSSPPPSTVRRFAWITDAGERAYRLDKFEDVARRMMARRSVEPGPAYLTRLGALHERHAQVAS